jgi:hypothetical protein
VAKSRAPKEALDPYSKFQAAYHRWLGISGVEIEEDAINNIKSYFKINDIYIDISERRWPDNADLLMKVLKKLGYSRYMSDLNLLANKLWNRSLPQPPAEDTEEKLESYWRAAQEILEKNKTADDSSGVPGKIDCNGWRLWHHLIQVGFDCSEREFQITTNKKTKDRLESFWDKVCSEKGWKTQDGRN